MIKQLKNDDAALIKEIGIKSLSRVVGYNENGEPVELVYVKHSYTGYEWHVGGEYQSDASLRSVEKYAHRLNHCLLV